jgi:very-short-patch-repair endonuclease
MKADISKRRAGSTAIARRLRVEDTEPEYRLWSDLRARRLNGYKFARQIPLGLYVVDFVCRDELLIVELDGSQHAESARDDLRTVFLTRHGYSVLRFWNDEVLRERRAVLDTILAALKGRVSPSPGLRFAQSTLSPKGEEDTELSRRALWRKRQRNKSRDDLGRNHADLPLPSWRAQGEGAATPDATLGNGNA